MPDNRFTDIDDATLMTMAKHDDAAFAELVKRYQKILLNFFIRSGVQYDGEDLVQQTFLRLYRYRDRYKPRARFTTFMFMIARQVWIDEIRRRNRQQELQQKLVEDPLFAESKTSSGASPKGNKLDLAEALVNLPEKLRQVVELGMYQDLPYDEVATILKIPVGTVKSRMFNALKKLREFMTNNGGDQNP